MLRYIEFQAPHRAVMAHAAAPEPGPGEAVIETIQSGISLGTERMWLDGSAAALRSGRRFYPYRPGYALVGRIAAIGDDFFDLPVGSRVFAMKPHGSHALLRRDDPWVALPDAVADDDAVAIALTATALHAVERAALNAGSGVAVAGLGALGLILIQVLAAMGAGPIVAVTGTPAKAALARRHGATTALTYADVAEPGASLPPVQALFECSGVAANIARVAPLVGERGEIVGVGFYNDPIVLDGEAMFARELRYEAVRSIGTGAERSRNVARAGELVMSGKVRAGALVTHRFPAARFDQAYRLVADRAASRRAIRVDLLWQDA